MGALVITSIGAWLIFRKPKPRRKHFDYYLNYGILPAFQSRAAPFTSTTADPRELCELCLKLGIDCVTGDPINKLCQNEISFFFFWKHCIKSIIQQSGIPIFVCYYYPSMNTYTVSVSNKEIEKTNVESLPIDHSTILIFPYQSI